MDPICPITHTKIAALGTAIAASFIFGYVWYGPLFGKTWAGLMGFKMDAGKCGKPPISSLLLTLLGTVFTVFVLAYLLKSNTSCCSVGTAFVLWLGFNVPILFSSVSWEGRPLKLFALNAAFYLLNLQLIAAILTFLG